MAREFLNTFATHFCLISVGYHLGVRIALFFFMYIVVFYQLSCVILFGVHTKCLCYLDKKMILLVK